METTIINGKVLAQTILDQLHSELSTLTIKPQLLIIQVGNDAASNQYVELKKKRGEETGIEVKVAKIDTNSLETIKTEIENIIIKEKKFTNGILIQLPLPKGCNTEEVLSLIPPELDVDGLLLQKSPYNTAVADAVITLMKSQKNISRTSQILVIGDSLYVGNSIITALKKDNYEYVTGINELTPHKQQHMRKATVVISCIGKPHVYETKLLHKGCVLIDVGTSKNELGKIVGDFDITKAEGHLTAYTPVPGGVGPMTVALLLQHVTENALKLRSI